MGSADLLLMDLPAFKKGMALLASDLNRLANQVRASRITSVIGGRVDVTPGGTALTVFPQPGGASGATVASEEFPFRLFAAEESVKINLNSFLLRDATGDTVSISNLSTFFCIPTVGQQIILEITINAFGVPSSAELKCGAWQDIWPTYTNPIVRDQTTKLQTKLIVSIGECSDETDDRDGFIFTDPALDPPVPVKVVQMVRTDLCCFLAQVRGLPAVLAMPWGRHNQVA